MADTAQARRDEQLALLHYAQAKMRRALSLLATDVTDPADVAERLRKHSVFGAPFSSSLHPLVVFLATVTNLDYIRIGNRQLHYTVCHQVLPLEPIPDIVWQFIGAFDAGEYPDMELESISKTSADGRCEYCDTSLLMCKCFPAHPEPVNA